MLLFRYGGPCKYSCFPKNRPVTHDEVAFSDFISRDMQPCLFSGNLNRLFKRNEDIHHDLLDKILQSMIFGAGVSLRAFHFTLSPRRFELGKGPGD